MLCSVVHYAFITVSSHVIFRSKFFSKVAKWQKTCFILFIYIVLRWPIMQSLNVIHTLSFSGTARGRWYKFNDNMVEEFEMNDETLEYECFGGEYRPKVYDQCKWHAWTQSLNVEIWKTNHHKKTRRNLDLCVQPTHTLMCGGDTGTLTCCSIRRLVTRIHLSCLKRAEWASWGKKLKTSHCESNFHHMLLIIYHYLPCRCATVSRSVGLLCIQPVFNMHLI